MNAELLIRKLVPVELERALSAAYLSNPALRQARDGGVEALHVDLSAVAWVDIGTTAQLVILIDDWARSISVITVTLPSSVAPLEDRSEHERGRRATASRFLRYIRFHAALAHIAARRKCQVRVLQDGSEASASLAGEDFPETYKRVVPLHWVALSNFKSRNQLALHMTDALRNSGEGIDGPDAQALSNVVLYELIQNVSEHASSGDSALVCGFAHAKLYYGIETDFLAEELPFLEASRDTEQPLLEIIVGDSGKGIVPTLEESFRRGPGLRPGNLTRSGRALAQNVVRWAFDRWSSEKDAHARERGVRGLYRVDRLVAKYFGQISVRTGQTFFVREHLANTPPSERYNKAPNRFAHQPGTILRIRMTGVTVPGISELAARLQSTDRHVAVPLLPTDAPVETFVVTELFEQGFGHVTETQIVEVLGSFTRRPIALFVVLAALGKGGRSLENALRFLCSHGNPVPVYAVNVRCSIDELEDIASSINSECDANEHSADGSASAAERLDVICAVHESGVIRWLGVPTNVAELVQDIGPGDRVSIPHHLYQSVLASKYRLETFFSIEDGGETHPYRQLRCKADLRPFSERVAERFVASLGAADSRIPRTTWSDGPYLTPTLNFVARWMRIDLLLERLNDGDFEALVFEFSRAMRSSFEGRDADQVDVLRGLYLAAEDRSSVRMRDALISRFRFVKLEPPVETRSELSYDIGSKVPVIVYADIVSSGESLRRTAQTVLRQGYSVAAVVALVDTRREPNPFIEAFGLRIPLIALIREPNEVKAPDRFSVVSPNLLYSEAESIGASALVKSVRIDRKKDDYIWSALDFGHRIRSSGRHLTLTLDPQRLLISPRFIARLKVAVESSHLYASLQNETSPIVVLCPIDERESSWRTTVTTAFEELELTRPFTIEFISRAMNGGAQALDLLHPHAAKIRNAPLVIVFDWGVISGKTVDALTNGAAQSGASQIQVIAVNSQLPAAELGFRGSVSEISGRRDVPSDKDLLAPPELVQTKVRYAFVVLSELSLGQYAAYDCPVCKQADELHAIACPDASIASYREGALLRLRHPEAERNPQFSMTRPVVESIAGLRAVLVQAQTKTASRFALTQNVAEELTTTKSSATVTAFQMAMVELLYAEGNWIQLPPIRYKQCRDPVAGICLHVIRRGNPDLKAKAISVLRRVSKTEFIRRASEIFKLSGHQSRARGALLFGIHTYLARRYHETAKMLEPAIHALGEIQAAIAEDSQKQKPVLASAYDSVQHLRFQARFLGSRAKSRELGLVEAVSQLRDLISEPNYYAHGVQNQAIEHLLARQYLTRVRSGLLEEQQNGDESKGLQDVLEKLLQIRLDAWQDVHQFLTSLIIPNALASRKIFESRQFRDALPQGDAQWFLNLLDVHKNGLAPELSPGKLLGALQARKDLESDRPSPSKILETMDAATVELNRLLNVILRARQYGQAPAHQTPVQAAQLKLFLDDIRSNVYSCLVSAARELTMRHERAVDISLSPHSREDDYFVCCHAGLLREATVELLNNIGKHGANPSNGVINARVTCEFSGDRVVVTISNRLRDQPVAVSDPQRHGLALFRKDLLNFGGALEVLSANEQQEFVVRLTLLRWR